MKNFPPYRFRQWRSWVLIGGLVAFVSFGILVSCKPENNPEPDEPTPYALDKPAHFPSFLIPEDNQLTEERVALGKRLFFDKQLSSTRTVSCATCHKPELAFSDGLALARGVEGRTPGRNAPSLTNVAYVSRLNWDGGVPTLEQQAIVPITNHLEMDMTFEEIVNRLSQDETYVEQFQAAYERGPDTYTIVRALSAFERTLISGNSPYDKYLSGEDTNALSASAKRGRELFFSEKAECFHCHGGLFLTTNQFENNGLYEEYEDKGRYNITGRDFDKGKFKVPTLRNIALTAPYMHDGSLATLEEVIDHYASGGKNHPNKSAFLVPLALTEQDKEDLKNFLHSLTDEEFINNPAFRPQ